MDKPRGRPPLTEGDTPARVHVTVPSKDFDKADQIAKREECSVPELLRRGLARLLSEADE